jgi:hypothetical protein
MESKRSKHYLKSVLRGVFLDHLKRKEVKALWLSLVLRPHGLEDRVKLLLLIYPDKLVYPDPRQARQGMFRDPINWGLNMREMAAAVHVLNHHRPREWPQEEVVNFMSALFNSNVKYFESIVYFLDTLGLETMEPVLRREFTAMKQMPFTQLFLICNHLNRGLAKVASVSETNFVWIQQLLEPLNVVDVQVKTLYYKSIKVRPSANLRLPL